MWKIILSKGWCGINKKAVFLGRFQPFHKGHHRTVEKHKQAYEEMAVAIGSSSKSRTEENPLTFEERKDIIRSCHPDVKIRSLEDEDRGEEGYQSWAERLLEKTEPDVVITRNELVQRLIRKYSDVEIEEQQLYGPKSCSGTRIRKLIRKRDDWRHLVPDCNEDEIEEYAEIIRKTG